MPTTIEPEVSVYVTDVSDHSVSPNLRFESSMTDSLPSEHYMGSDHVVEISVPHESMETSVIIPVHVKASTDASDVSYVIPPSPLEPSPEISPVVIQPSEISAPKTEQVEPCANTPVCLSLHSDSALRSKGKFVFPTRSFYDYTSSIYSASSIFC